MNDKMQTIVFRNLIFFVAIFRKQERSRLKLEKQAGGEYL